MLILQTNSTSFIYFFIIYIRINFVEYVYASFYWNKVILMVVAKVKARKIFCLKRQYHTIVEICDSFCVDEIVNNIFQTKIM